MSVRRVDDRSLYRGHTRSPPLPPVPAGTAHGPAVELKPRAGATTGGYLVIDQPQADAIMGELENGSRPSTRSPWSGRSCARASSARSGAHAQA